MERIDDGAAEEIETDVEPTRSSLPVARIVVAAIVLGAIVLGWRFMAPRHALSKAGWNYDWDAAVEQSRSTGKPALALFTADWCGPCRQFKSQVLSDADVQQYLRDNYTLVVVDLTKQSGPNAQRASEFGVRSIPTLILYDEAGQERARSNGMPADALMAWLNSSGGGARAGSRR